MGDIGSKYWAWRDRLLAHPDGRAKGGEPCVQCSEPVPANAHWKHRDRHVCSDRCNRNLGRKINRQIERGDYGDRPTESDLHVRPLSSPPLSFLSARTDNGELVLGHLGLGPRPGDVVERSGAITAYGLVDGAYLPRPMGPSSAVYTVCISEAGWMLVTSSDPTTGRPGRVTYGLIDPEGRYQPLDDRRTFIGSSGVRYQFALEVIRDIDDDGHDLEWWNYIAVPADLDVATVWSDRFQRRSEMRLRSSASTGRHARRMRLDAATIEKFDPHEIYERDRWTCQLCGVAVDPRARFPDWMSSSLDHVVPLVAGGEHSRANTQLAHWICNVRKGAKDPDDSANGLIVGL